MLVKGPSREKKTFRFCTLNFLRGLHRGSYSELTALSQKNCSAEFVFQSHIFDEQITKKILRDFSMLMGGPLRFLKNKTCRYYTVDFLGTLRVGI